MSSLMDVPESKSTNDRLDVHGYIRENFDKRCWIEEIVQTIIEFYGSRGGSLYMFGDNEDNCLGMMQYNNQKKCVMPTLLHLFHQNNVLDVSCWYHTLILDIDGNVKGCGNAVVHVCDSNGNECEFTLKNTQNNLH